jgi:hypothetical protein
MMVQRSRRPTRPLTSRRAVRFSLGYCVNDLIWDMNVLEEQARPYLSYPMK